MSPHTYLSQMHQHNIMLMNKVRVAVIAVNQQRASSLCNEVDFGFL